LLKLEKVYETKNIKKRYLNVSGTGLASKFNICLSDKTMSWARLSSLLVNSETSSWYKSL